MVPSVFERTKNTLPNEPLSMTFSITKSSRVIFWLTRPGLQTRHCPFDSISRFRSLFRFSAVLYSSYFGGSKSKKSSKVSKSSSHSSAVVPLWSISPSKPAAPEIDYLLESKNWFDGIFEMLFSMSLCEVIKGSKEGLATPKTGKSFFCEFKYYSCITERSSSRWSQFHSSSGRFDMCTMKFLERTRRDLVTPMISSYGFMKRTWWFLGEAIIILESVRINNFYLVNHT